MGERWDGNFHFYVPEQLNRSVQLQVMIAETSHYGPHIELSLLQGSVPFLVPKPKFEPAGTYTPEKNRFKT